MRIKLLTILMLLLGFGFAKTKTIEVENTQVLNKELQGFEADYLSKAEFRKQVKEHKQIFGWIIDTIVNWVAPATRHVSAAHVE